MTPERTIEAFDSCATAISTKCPAATSAELLEETKKRAASGLFLAILANHLLYMCDTGKQFVQDERIEKAMRWLGFVQGALWALGIATIDEMKRWNMPKEEV